MSLISSVISFFHAGREQRCIYRKQQRPLRMQYVHPWEENKGQGKENQCVALANLCARIIHGKENWEISSSLIPAYFQTLNVDCCPVKQPSTCSFRNWDPWDISQSHSWHKWQSHDLNPSTLFLESKCVLNLQILVPVSL